MFDYETKHLSISMKDTNIQLASRNLFLKLNTILFVLNKQLPEIGMKNTNDAMVGTFLNETSHLTLPKKSNDTPSIKIVELNYGLCSGWVPTLLIQIARLIFWQVRVPTNFTLILAIEITNDKFTPQDTLQTLVIL